MRAALVLVLSLLVAGCLEGPGPATSQPTPSPPATPIPSPPGSVSDVAIRSLAAGQYGGIREAERVVLHTAAEYEAFWARVREDDAQTPPPVDLSSSTVVGVAIGARPDGCWNVRVTNATQRDGITTVEVTTLEPGPAQACTEAITHPWHLAALDGAGREVTFVDLITTGAPPPAPPPSTVTPSPAGPTSIPFRSLGDGQQGGPEAPERGAYDSADEWVAASERYPAVEGTIDFGRETLVAVALGQRSDGCWAIRVTNATQRADASVLVEVTTHEPSPDRMCAQVVTYPWHVVALSGSYSDVEFEERNATYGST